MKSKNYCTQRKVCLHSNATSGFGADYFIASLVAPGLPIVPAKIYSDEI